MFSAILYLLINTMSDSMVWVKEIGNKGTAFTVIVSSSALVDHLKDAIKIKIPNSVHCDAYLLSIKTENGDVEKVGNEVSVILKGKRNDDDHPIYFSQPAPPGKFIMSLSYILCLYFAVTVLYIFMLF